MKKGISGQKWINGSGILTWRSDRSLILENGKMKIARQIQINNSIFLSEEEKCAPKTQIEYKTQRENEINII